MWELEDVEAFAKSLHPAVTADLFAEDWVSFRIAGKWFLVFDLTVVEPRIAVKLDPEYALDLRDRHPGIRPAWHMNKRHWSNVYLHEVDPELVKALVAASFEIVFAKLTKKQKEALAASLSA